MNKYPDFFKILVGPGPVGYFFGYCFLSFAAAVALTAAMAAISYSKKANTPEKWSWRYFIADNLGNLIAAFLLLPLFVRFVYPHIDSDHSEYMVFLSIGLGFGFKGLAKIANNFGLWTTKALSKKVADKLDTKDSVG